MHHTFKQYPNSLRKHRKNAGLRQRDVARALKLSNCERISKWENGKAVPILWTLFQLAALYHVSPQELYDEMYRKSIAPASDIPSDTDTRLGNVLPILEDPALGNESVMSPS